MTNTTNELVVIAQESGLDELKVESLLTNFGGSFQQAKDLASEVKDIVVTDESQTELMAKARTSRLKFKNIRVEVEHTRKQLKEQGVREGKAIDGMANIIKAIIVPIEENLEKQEKFAEVKAAERKATRHADRLEKLSKYVDNVSVYSIEDMEDTVFDTLLTQSKEAYEAKIKAQEVAEAERITKEKEEAERQEATRLENIRLKKEAEEQAKREAKLKAEHDAAIEAERKKAAVAQKVADDKRAAELAKERKASEVAAAKQAEELRKEREAREEAERKIAEEKTASDKKAKEDEEVKRQALLAPDKEKLIAYANIIDALEAPNVANREAGKLLDETQDFLDRISKNLRNKAKEL